MAIAIGLLKVLLELGRSKKTGAFVAESGGTRVRLFVENGVIVQAEEGGVSETLGRLLLREKIVTQAQYDKALSEMAALRAKGQHVKLGEVMIAQGFLTRDELEEALEAQVRKKAVRAIGWPRANVSFVECHGGDLVVTARHPMPIEPVVLDALRTASRADIEQLFAQAKDRYVGLRADRVQGGGAARQAALAMVASFDATEEETAFASSLDGTHKASELLAAGDGGHLAILGALLLTDCLDLHAAQQSTGASKLPKPAAEPARPRPVLRGPKLRKRAAASEDSNATKPAPGAIATPAAAIAIKTPAAAIAIKTPSAALEPPARVLAEQSFQNGKRLVRSNQMREAATELNKAASLFDAPEYLLWAAYATMRIDPKGEKAHYPELQKIADRAIAEDPECGFAYFVLGHLALRSGEESRALVMFDRARSLDKESMEGSRDAKLPEAAPEVSITKSAPKLKVEDSPPPPQARTTSSVSGAEKPPPSSSRTAPAVELSAPAIAVIAPANEPPAPAKESGAVANAEPPAPAGRKWIVAALGAVAIAAIAIVALRKGPEPARPTVPATAPAPSLAPSPAPSASPLPSASAASSAPTANAGDDAGAAAEEIDLDAVDAGAAAPSTDAGFLDFPDAAGGHRVFMDGKTLGEPFPTEVACGSHVVRIGGQGRDQKIDVPCGGRVLVPYP